MVNVCFESTPRVGLERNDGYKQQQRSFYNKQQGSYIVSEKVFRHRSWVEKEGRWDSSGDPVGNGSLFFFSDISVQLTVVEIIDKPVVDAEDLHVPKWPKKLCHSERSIALCSFGWPITYPVFESEMLHLRKPLVKFIEDLSYGRYLRGERDAWDLYTKGICLGLLTGIHLHINTSEKELGLEVLCCVRKLQDSWETWDGEHCRKNVMHVQEMSGWVGQTHEGALMYLCTFYTTQNIWVSIWCMEESISVLLKTKVWY